MQVQYDTTHMQNIIYYVATKHVTDGTFAFARKQK